MEELMEDDPEGAKETMDKLERARATVCLKIPTVFPLKIYLRTC